MSLLNPTPILYTNQGVGYTKAFRESEVVTASFLKMTACLLQLPLTICLIHTKLQSLVVFLTASRCIPDHLSIIHYNTWIHCTVSAISIYAGLSALAGRRIIYELFYSEKCGCL